MGDILDDFFDRHDKPKEPETPKAPEPTEIYTPPKLADVYQQYLDTGRVPYSYYGVGAPTREGELALVKASYPGAFTTPAPAPMPTTPAPSTPAAPTRTPNPLRFLVDILSHLGQKDWKPQDSQYYQGENGWGDPNDWFKSGSGKGLKGIFGGLE